MRTLPALLVLTLFAAGCAMQNGDATPADVKPPHPAVRVAGVDGTVFSGELLNGSVTIDSGQGPLTLLTDHIATIDFSAEADTVDSASVKVSGKIKDSVFLLRSEHGVFALQKERLKKIEFVNAQQTHSLPSAAATTSASSGSASGRPRNALVSP